MSIINIPVDLHGLIPGRPPVPLGGVLHWDSRVPVEVQLVITHGHNEQTWVASRNLITDGQLGTATVGEGDVRIGPHEEAHLLRIDLSSPAGTASLSVPRLEVADFLRSTWLVCPPDQEWVAIEAALDAFWAPDMDGAS
jgi:hypothetical protein